MLTVKEIANYGVWKDFFDKSGSPSFLQSWEWGEFEKKMGYDIIRLGLYKKNELQAIALVIKVKSKRGNFLFIPHGPIFVKRQTLNVKHYLKELKNYLLQMAKKENFSFIRIAPICQNGEIDQKIFNNLGFRQAPLYMHAETIWVLPLIKTDEQLLSQMRKTTRYLIKKAVKEGIVVEKRTDEAAVEDFYKIYEQTARRENFIPFSKKFIQDEFETFHKTGHAIFLFARKKSEILNPKSEINSNLYLATALIIFTDSTAFYHQGASIHSKVPASYLLQWEAIKEAKKRGCRLYNFWGVHKPGRTPKAWLGLSMFKQGFGGQQIDYLPTQDFIISPKYYLTYLYEYFLSLKRGV